MALNLNKGGEESPIPTGEKKGFNLNKSGDDVKASPNLTKERVDNSDTIYTSTTQESKKKKSPILYIVVAIVLLGIGAYWISIQKGNSENVTAASTVNNSTSIDTPVVQQIEQPQSSNEINSKAAESTQSIPTEKTNQANPTNETNGKSTENVKTVPSSKSEVVVTPIENKSKIGENTKTNPTNKSKEAKPTNSANAPDVNTSAAVSAKDSKITITTPSSSDPAKQLQGTVEEKAKMVIRGDFGNGEDRKNALGADYAEIQAMVNELYRSVYQ